MQNVVLVIHLLLALALIGIVLLQRSEGGGLGMGGGGAGGGAMTGRAAASAMTKLTWILAIAFICTSLGLTLIETGGLSESSVISGAPATTDAVTDGSELLPTLDDSSEPLLPVAE